MATQIYKIRTEIWVTPEIWLSKNIKFPRDFAQLRDLIANISGTQQDIIKWKTALQTADNHAEAHLKAYFHYGCAALR